MIWASAYQQLTSDQDQDTAVNARLSIKGGDLMLDLLEGKALEVFCQSDSCPFVAASLTTSFSTIAAAPCVAEDSKVNIDWSRYSPIVSFVKITSFNAAAHVEGSKLLSIGVELGVVKGHELVCCQWMLIGLSSSGRLLRQRDSRYNSLATSSKATCSIS
jgi:hypothetical protein